MLKPVELVADTPPKTSQRLIEMYEFFALNVVNARQLIAGTVPRQSSGNIHQPQVPSSHRQRRSFGVTATPSSAAEPMIIRNSCSRGPT